MSVTLACSECSRTFEHNARGRRPSRCPTCRISTKVTRTEASPTLVVMPLTERTKSKSSITRKDPTKEIADALAALASAMEHLATSITHLLREWPL